MQKENKHIDLELNSLILIEEIANSISLKSRVREETNESEKYSVFISFDSDEKQYYFLTETDNNEYTIKLDKDNQYIKFMTNDNKFFIIRLMIKK